jgi:hypothetical protein
MLLVQAVAVSKYGCSHQPASNLLSTPASFPHTAEVCCVACAACRKALATVPLLGHVLQRSSLLRLVGRRLSAGAFPAFDELLSRAQQAGAPVMVLWPGPGAACREEGSIVAAPLQLCVDLRRFAR